MVEKNPNHKEEKKVKKDLESEEVNVDHSQLIKQDINENFLNLKNDLIFYKDKSKMDEIRSNLEEELQFVKIKDEISPDDVKAMGLDFCILADVSESMHPYRIYLKKSMYFALKDIENFVYRSLESPNEFPNIRIAIVKYSDRDSVDKPGKVDILDFVEYSSLDKVCKKIDEIEIKANSLKKRAVFDGIKAMGGLSWNSDSIKVILHYCGDPQYGVQYTTNPKKMPEDYDPFPNGILDLKEDEVLEPVSNLGATYNFLAMNNDRLTKFYSLVTSKLTLDVNAPKVIPIN